MAQGKTNLRDEAGLREEIPILQEVIDEKIVN